MTFCFSPRITLTSSLLLASVVAIPAQAATVSADEAARLSTTITQEITPFFARLGLPAQNVNLAGDVKVEVKGNGYAVTLPPMDVNFVHGNSMKLDTVTMTLVPRDDDSYATDVKLPLSIDFFADNAAQKLTFGSVTIKGDFYPQYNTFMSGDMQATDLLYAPSDTAPIHLDSVAYRSVMKRIKGDIWSGPTAFSVKGVKIDDEKNGGSISIKELAGTGNVANMNMAHVTAIQQKVKELEEKAPQADEMQTIIAMMSGLFSDVDMTMKISDIKFDRPADDESDAQSVALKNLVFSLNMKDFDKDGAKISFGYNHKGLSIDPIPQGMDSRTLPTDTLIKINVEKLPLQTMAALLQKAVKDGEVNEEIFTGAMTEAKTRILLETFDATSELVQGHAAGAATVDDQAAHGATGAFTLVMSGLDEAIKTMMPKEGNGKDVDGNAMQQAMMLSMFQAMGQAGKDAKGNSTRSYALEITKDGQVTLNGTDLSMLMGGGAQAGEGSEEVTPDEEGTDTEEPSYDDGTDESVPEDNGDGSQQPQ